MAKLTPIDEEREKWRKHIYVCLAGSDSFIDDVDPEPIENNDINRSLFNMFPFEHRRHEVGYTMDSKKRHINNAEMALSPGAREFFEDVRMDMVESMREAYDKAGLVYASTLPSTMETIRDAAKDACSHFDSDAEEAIRKVMALIDDIDANEKALGDKAYDIACKKTG